MNHSKRVILIISLLIFFGKLSAQIVTDRPDQTESSATVGGGNLQIESGILVGFEGEGGAEVSQALLPTSLFRYGISQVVELRLLSQYEVQETGNNTLRGITDLEVGAKIQLLRDPKKNTEIALMTHVVFPTGSQGVAGGRFGAINRINISHALSEKFGLAYNLGYNFFDDGQGEFTYSLALGVGVNDKISMYIEPYGHLTNSSDFIVNFDAGLAYLVTQNIQLDFSFGVGLNQKMNYLSVGCSWLIPAAGKKK